ncbi:MAG: hypothetical protein GX130_08840 [Candidatus Hydrogenedens sp.]|jgi:hypothetical protein|nr:hypothetical protein [Candidatus Hydrogenedens sp.]
MDTHSTLDTGGHAHPEKEQQSVMNDSFPPENAPLSEAASALFIGDFNVGKSSVLNALIRRNLLFTSREESRTPPVFLARTGDDVITYSGYNPAEKDFVNQSHSQFLSMRRHGRTECPFTAMSALIPRFPFTGLMLVDTPGTSTEIQEQCLLPRDAALERSLVVLVTTVEYWAARHTLALITEYTERFAGRFVVVANMADQLNHKEILRIRDKASKRIESLSQSAAPPFYIVSAKLEHGRPDPEDEYRRRVKSEVRDLCDAGFDALRVALYEFEAACQTPEAACPLNGFIHPLLSALTSLNQQEIEA